MITMVAGLIGVPLGSFMAQRLRPTIRNCDPYICAAGLLASAPMVYLSLILPQTSATWCFIFIFGAQLALNMTWSIVADILLVRFKSCIYIISDLMLTIYCCYATTPPSLRTLQIVYLYER